MLFEEMCEVLDPQPHGAAFNMALDEVLLADVREPLLRIYRWERPAVSFGYFGKVAEVARTWPGPELMRRWTGGGVVPHGEDFTYTLVVPRVEPLARMAPAESYRVIHEALARALVNAGEPVSIATDAGAKISDACFENAVAFDVLAGGRKIAGAAQRRTLAGLLHQGSVQSARGPEDLAAAFARRVKRRALTADEMTRAAELAAAKYATDAWLRRR